MECIPDPRLRYEMEKPQDACPKGLERPGGVKREIRVVWGAYGGDICEYMIEHMKSDGNT